MTTVASHPKPFVYLKVPGDLDVSVHGGWLSGSDQPLQLSTAVVLSLGCQLLDVHVAGEQVEASHLGGVDVQDLDAALLVRQTWRLDSEEGAEEKTDIGVERQGWSVELWQRERGRLKDQRRSSEYIYKWEINNIALILMSLSTHLL